MNDWLIVVDRPHWAFDAIAQALVRHGADALGTIEVFHQKNNEHLLEDACKRSNNIFFMHWSLPAEIQKTLWSYLTGDPFSARNLRQKRQFPFLNLATTLTGLHAHHDWDDRQTQPDRSVPPPQHLVEFLKRFKAVNAVSQRLTGLFRDAGLPGVCCTPNGVDIEMFRPLQPVGGATKLRVGCTGSRKRDWKEGITEFIEPLAALPFVELKLATFGDKTYRPYEEMPAFLNEIDVYVLASASEGFPLKVLEASACGRPVVTTRVGGCEDLIRDGENGLFVDRSVEAFAAQLKLLHENRERLRSMSEKARAIVESDWSWERRIGPWIDFMTANSV